MIHIKEQHWKIVQEILRKYPYTFYAFGSRVKGDEKRFSDLDLCFKDPIPLYVQAHIDEDFEESDLPFKIDVMDWNLMRSDFQKLIKEDLVLVQNGSKVEEKV